MSIKTFLRTTSLLTALLVCFLALYNRSESKAFLLEQGYTSVVIHGRALAPCVVATEFEAVTPEGYIYRGAVCGSSSETMFIYGL